MCHLCVLTHKLGIGKGSVFRLENNFIVQMHAAYDFFPQWLVFHVNFMNNASALPCARLRESTAFHKGHL